METEKEKICSKYFDYSESVEEGWYEKGISRIIRNLPPHLLDKPGDRARMKQYLDSQFPWAIRLETETGGEPLTGDSLPIYFIVEGYTRKYGVNHPSISEFLEAKEGVLKDSMKRRISKLIRVRPIRSYLCISPYREDLSPWKRAESKGGI